MVRLRFFFFGWIIFWFSQAALSNEIEWSRKIARKIIADAYCGPLGPSLPERPPDGSMFENTRILLEVGHESVEGIIRDGILNQFQVGTENTLAAKSDKSRRRRLSSERSGSWGRLDSDMQESNPYHFLRPKYAFLDLTRRVSSYHRPTFIYGEYGNVIFVLKDRVKRRSTWTRQDSFNSPGKAFTFYDSPEIWKVSGYAEAQIWGEVDLRDISEIWVRESVPDLVVDSLIGVGLPLYIYEKAKYNNGDGYHRRRRRISPGNELKIELLDQVVSEPWSDWRGKEEFVSHRCDASLR